MILNSSHEIGTYGKLAKPRSGQVFLTDQICFSYFGRQSFSDYVYQIILNSDHPFHKRKFFEIAINHAPYSFFFVEGHLITTSAKSFSILTTSFRGEDV